MTPELADKTIQDALCTMKENHEVEIGFFGGSFTGIEKNVQEACLKVAYKYVKNGDVKSIRVSTRPDYISHECVEFLKSYGVDLIELGAQSMDDDVLLQNRRGHTSADTERASSVIKSAGLKLGLQMMTGLLGDTDEIAIETAKKIISLSPDCVRIYPTLVLKGTYLADLFLRKEYVPQTLDAAVSLCARLKQEFDKTNIPVIRMGLLSSDSINLDKEVLAGPYHPAFGELVLSEICFQKLRNVVTSNAELFVNPKSVSFVLGCNKKNVKKMHELGFKIDIVQDNSVSPYEIFVKHKKGGDVCVLKGLK